MVASETGVGFENHPDLSGIRGTCAGARSALTTAWLIQKLHS